MEAGLYKDYSKGMGSYQLAIGDLYSVKNRIYTLEIKEHIVDGGSMETPTTVIKRDEIPVLQAIGRALQKEGMLEDLNADAAELKATKYHLEDMRLIANVPLVVKNKDL